MASLKLLGVILAALVFLDHIDETSAGWFRVRVVVPIWKKKLDLHCPEAYGIACKAAKADIGTGDNIDFSGTGCKMAPNKVCQSQTSQLSSITPPDGLKYVPLPKQFGYYDMDNDQKITFEEFSVSLLARYQMQDPMTLKAMFDAADVNGDGVLNPDEFSKAPFIQVSVSGNSGA